MRVDEGLWESLPALLPIPGSPSLVGYRVDDRLVWLDGVQHRKREAPQEEATDFSVVAGSDLGMLADQIPGPVKLFDEVQAEADCLIVVISDDRMDLVLGR